MFVLVRAIIYASIFIYFFLMFAPARILSPAGIVRPASIGLEHIAGMIMGIIGIAIALWCVFTFVLIGKGTPAPFDPPRRLVTDGPYRYVRNPMVMGAGLALIGATLFYKSLRLLGYTGLFFLVLHLFVVFYEEPTLRNTFGQDYEEYCRKVRRWFPRF